MSTSTSHPSSAAPLENFSHCHAGILQQLTVTESLPQLALAAEQARQQAGAVLQHFREVVLNHHAEEERLLFTAVLDSAVDDVERAGVQTVVARLTREHRQLEFMFAKLEPELRKMARGQSCLLEAAEVNALVRQYRAHARFEEEEFLPLSHTILSRNSNHLAALGLSLHVRYVPVPTTPT